MGQLVALDTLLSDRRIWRGQPATALPAPKQPTGHAALDAVLPWGGWPEASLTELLLPADGVGELRLLLPTLARLTQAGHDIAIVAPPYLPYPDGWRQAGVDFAHVHLIDANPRDALWASEQCLRSGCLSAVLGWPIQADDRALRRLQVAADTGGVMGFVFRDARAGRNPSPAALRIAIESTTADGGSTQLRVLKCRGGTAPVKPVLLRDASSSSPFATRSDLRNAECGSVKASVISLPAAIGEKRPEDPAVYSLQGRMRGAPGTA
jgi:hypothetical protein